jgi:hypothetical protein
MSTAEDFIKIAHCFKSSVMKRIWIWMLFFTYAGYGQNGYRIELTVKGLKDTTAYLGY